jgi:PAS domain-containing protein
VKRRPFEIALSVFAFSVTTELLCIKILRGSLIDWLNHPHRQLLLLSLVLVNLLNAVTAMYFCSRAARAEVRLKLRERKQEQVSVYLNHHLRNALSIVQNAAFLTNDEQTIKQCDEAVERIVSVLVSHEAGLTDPSVVLFAAVNAKRSGAKSGDV